jgi:hypothetical protein
LAFAVAPEFFDQRYAIPCGAIFPSVGASMIVSAGAGLETGAGAGAGAGAGVGVGEGAGAGVEVVAVDEAGVGAGVGDGVGEMRFLLRVPSLANVAAVRFEVDATISSLLVVELVDALSSASNSGAGEGEAISCGAS